MNLFPVPVETVRHAAPPRSPAATVIVTLFNYAHFVGDCLASLAAQTQPDLELVIVDDASTDASRAVAASWLDLNAGAFCGHRLLAHASNMGLSTARNTAFAHATAGRVFVMDADNELYPRAIERCMEAMTADSSAGAYTQLELFGDQQGIGNADFWDRERFRTRNFVDAMALVSKAAWQQVGGYSQLGVAGCEDYDFWCKFVEHGLHCTYVPEILCRYRVHGRSMLRTETLPNMPSLALELSLRHPWLELS